MLNFEYYNPTRIIFGRDQLSRLPELLEENNVSKILIAYGGGSVKKTGTLQDIKDHLSNFDVIEFGGIEPNPEYTTLMMAVDLCKAQQVDFILAVGGGSVIDGVKFITGAVKYHGEPWDVLEKKEGCTFEKALPFGSFLTLPATGSEANSGAVVNRSEIGEKRVMGGPVFFPKFSFCDPEQVKTLPPRQIANGIIDAYVHTLEQYLTYPTDNYLQERQAEAILSTLIEIGPDIMNSPGDYFLASNLMWCATNALNGVLRCGVPTDWATHMIGHEYTAKFGIDHARTLAIVGPRLYENQFENKKEKLVQYGKRVWGLIGEDETIAREAIIKTEDFFRALGVQTVLSEYDVDFTGFAEQVQQVFESRDWVEMGEHGAVTPVEVNKIVQATYYGA